MRTKRKTRRSAGGGMGVAVTVLMFALMLALVVWGVDGLTGGATAQGAETLYQAIERAAVLCYATEGFYPPSLAYLEERYGVQVDQALYAVRYEVEASNMKPVIRVAPRQQ